MSPSQQQKLERLFLFLKHNGFNLTMESIAAGIHVTPKTLFNRYRNKESMELQVQDYWRNKFWSRFKQKQNHCNTDIEKLLLLTFEFNQSYEEEFYFFQREFQLEKMLTGSISPIFTQHTLPIINSGIAKGLFKEHPSPEGYVDYFLFNICTLFLNRNRKPDLLQYIFAPLLTDYGRVVFSEIDLESLSFPTLP